MVLLSELFINARTWTALNLLMSNRQRTYIIVKIPNEKLYKSNASVLCNKMWGNYHLTVQLKQELKFSLSLSLSLFFFFLWRCGPTRAMASSFTRFLDHTQRRTTIGRTPLDEWSARRRDLYLTTHNRQTSTPPAGFEPTISAGERPQTYAVDRVATGTGLNPLNAELNPICHLLALLGAHHILHVSRIRVKFSYKPQVQKLAVTPDMNSCVIYNSTRSTL